MRSANNTNNFRYVNSNGDWNNNNANNSNGVALGFTPRETEYEKMGGNGSAKRVMQEVNKLPIHNGPV